ncbi:HAD-IA family hydrolase [Devosia nitrariae]|uniref:Haloacid dehalogenase n=1 Tax=Devosia nitrariae TaxID=2071872 RepID=A0ABQ5WC59_9HYPH|nr:HAD-IA family hydrolase [Devosia nitrariae]GLQ57468.1 haloacid dehalogenase [Devosia nitrariae]
MLVMFDMDGTLIDTQSLICEHMATAFRGADLPAPTPEEVRRIIGLSLPVAIERLAGSQDDSLINRLVEDYKEHYRASLVGGSDREGLFPGARTSLDALRAEPDYVLGIATGKGLAGVSRILELHSLGDHFTTLQTPDHNPSKPHPGMLLRAMDETGAATSETVMVGDTVFDIELGRAAGVATIGVTWGYHDPADLVAAGADAMIDHFSDLAPVIRRLMD